MPDRQREINSLAGIESNVAGPTFGDHDSSDEEKKDEEVEAIKAKKDKGDVDSSSDEEGKSEELSDSEDEEVDVKKVKKGPGAKKAAPVKKPTAKANKKIQK